MSSITKLCCFNKTFLFVVLLLLGFVATFGASSVPNTNNGITEEDATTTTTTTAETILFPNNNNKDNDGYEWPSLYDEADDMLDNSMLMYPVAQLRKLARTDPTKFDDPEAVLKEPITASEILVLLEENSQLIDETLGEEKSNVVEDAIEAIVQRQKKGKNHTLSKATLLQFGDDNAQEELVYAIGIDRTKKRITVCFRGSTTKQDFIQDAKVWLTETENPYYSYQKGQPKNFGLHTGFYDYLFYEDEKEEKRDDGTIKSKYEIILDQVVNVAKEYPGYKLYVTGHSLGAALSSLFAFQASARDDIPKPVTCVSIASPYVGDGRFRKAFQFAESLGRIRYLRIANKRDIVTLVPFLSLKFRAYKHLGVELKLYKEKPSLLAYTKFGARYLMNAVKRTWSNSLLNNLTYRYLNNHGCKEYNERLDNAKSQLEGVYLNDLYNDPKMVGLLSKAAAKKEL